MIVLAYKLETYKSIAGNILELSNQRSKAVLIRYLVSLIKHVIILLQ